MERVAESFSFSGGKVDRSGPYPRIKGVVICGLRSVHGYEYDPRVWENGRAKAMYEGLDSFVGHAPDDQDRTAGKLGWWENVTVRTDGKPQGDYCLNPKHPLAESVLWAAQYRPDFYKMSHVADVRKVKKPDGRIVVENMAARARSIDLVENGGTTETLFESGRKRGTHVATKTLVTVREYANKLAPKCSVEQLLKLRTLVKEDGMGDAPMMPDAPDPAADATSGDDGIDSAFQAAAMQEIQECMDAKGDPAKLKRCLGRLKKLLMAHGELSADDGGAGDADADADPAKESGKTKPAAPMDPWVIVEECEKEQFKPDATDLKMLKLVSESGDRISYIRRQKGLTSATQPRGASREQIAAGDKKTGTGTGTGTVKEGGAGGEKPTGVEEARQVMAGLSKDLRGAS